MKMINDGDYNFSRSLLKPVAVILKMYHDSLVLFLISNILAYVLVNYPCYFVRN